MTGDEPPRETWWRLSKEDIRSRVGDVNDGVLAVAGLAEGLSAVIDTHSLPTIITVAAAAGAISIAGVRYSEVATELEVQQDLIRTEQYLLELSPAEELDELTQHFQDKGVSEETARRVAEELHASDALSAQLETEYGISEIIGRAAPFTEAMGSGVSFLLGALVSVLIAFAAPQIWVEEYIMVGVAVSLTLTALVLSRLGGTRVFATIMRSLFIGAAAMGASVVVGTMLG